jgi:hypothetical protein
MKRYSRYIVFLGSAFACVAINFWLITTGHYRWPLVVLVLCLVGTPLIVRKLPPITRDPEQIREYHVKAASSARRLGWIYVAGLVFGTLHLLSRGAKGIPWWAVVLILGWSGYLIWSCFWIANRFKNAAAAGQPDTPREPKV